MPPPSVKGEVCLSVCTTIFKRIAGLRFCPKSLMLYVHEWIRLDKLYNLWKAFLKFRIRLRIIDRKPKNIQTNSEA